MMLHRTVFGLGLFITCISVLGVLVPPGDSPYTSILPTGNDAMLTLLLGGVLVLLGWTTFVFYEHLTGVFAMVGLVLISAVGMGIFYPDSLGVVTSYIRPANLLVMLLTGISYLIMGLEVARTARDLAIIPVPSRETYFPQRVQGFGHRTYELFVYVRTMALSADSKIKAYSQQVVRTLF